jgi:hypothetical protein
VFWPGGTDVLAGHEYLYVEVVCRPIGGPFTMDRHTAADLAEALDPYLGLPIHSDSFDAIETDAGTFAADCGPDGSVVRHAWSDEDADRGEQGEEDADCQQYPDGERKVGLIPDETSVGVLRIEESPADREEREPRPVHATVHGFEVHGAADAGPGVLVVPPVTVGTAPRHTAGSGLSGKSVREPGTHPLVSTATVVSPAAVRVRTSTADGMYPPGRRRD